MTMPEWAVVALVGSILGVISWGIRRIVTLSDCTTKALTQINDHLAMINGRLGKSETWMTMHQESDLRQFADLAMKQQTTDMLIEKLRTDYTDPLGH